MKLKSELYIYELNLLIHGLAIQMRAIAETLRHKSKIFVIRSIFMPWTIASRSQSILAEAEQALELAKLLSELKDKIMEAEGIDDDMKPVTFREIIEKQEE
jgi:hypothetical protein